MILLVTGITARKTIFSFSKRPEKMVFLKKLPGIWSFLYYREWMFLFPEIWSYTLDGKWKMIFLKKNTQKYDIFFKLSAKMVFFPQKHDIFPWVGSERWPFSGNTWKHGIFCVQYGCYKRGATLIWQKKSKIILSCKNTPKVDWRSRLTS